jgi:glucose dehydrogenase
MELLFPSGRQPNANSTIAIDVDTGKIVWYYQHVPNDSWDFDSISENILCSAIIDVAHCTADFPTNYYAIVGVGASQYS